MPSIAADYRTVSYVNNISELKLNYHGILVTREIATDSKHPKAGYPFLAQKDGRECIFFPNTDLGVVNMRIIAEHNEHLLLKTQKEDVKTFRKRMWKRVNDFNADEEMNSENITKAIQYIATTGNTNYSEDYLRQDHMYLNDPNRQVNTNIQLLEDGEFINDSQRMVYKYIKRRQMVLEENRGGRAGKQQKKKRKAGERIANYLWPLLRRKRMLENKGRKFIYYREKERAKRLAESKALHIAGMARREAEIDAELKEDEETPGHRLYELKRLENTPGTAAYQMIQRDIESKTPGTALYLQRQRDLKLARKKRREMLEQASVESDLLKKSILAKMEAKGAQIRQDIARQEAKKIAEENKRKTDLLFNAILEGKEPAVAVDLSGLDAKHPAPVIAVIPSQSALDDSDVMIIDVPKIDPLVSDLDPHRSIQLRGEERDLRFSKLDTYTQNMIAFHRAKDIYRYKLKALAEAKSEIINEKREGKIPVVDAITRANILVAAYEKKFPALPPSIMLKALKSLDPRQSLTKLPPEKKKKVAAAKKKVEKKAEKKAEKKKPGRPKKKAPVAAAPVEKKAEKKAEKKKPGRPPKKKVVEEKKVVRKGPRIGAPAQFNASLAKIGKKPKPHAAVESDLKRDMDTKAIHRRAMMSEQKRKKKEEDAKQQAHHDVREATAEATGKIKKAIKGRAKRRGTLVRAGKPVFSKKDRLKNLYQKSRGTKRNMVDVLAARNKKRKRILLEEDALTDIEIYDSAEALTEAEEEELAATEIEDILESVEARVDPTQLDTLYPDYVIQAPAEVALPPAVFIPQPIAIAQPPAGFLQPVIPQADQKIVISPYFKPKPIIPQPLIPPQPPAPPPQDPVALLNTVKDLICNDDPRIVAARVALGCPPPAN